MSEIKAVGRVGKLVNVDVITSPSMSVTERTYVRVSPTFTI